MICEESQIRLYSLSLDFASLFLYPKGNKKSQSVIGLAIITTKEPIIRRNVPSHDWLFFNKTNGSKCGAFLFLYPAHIEITFHNIIILPVPVEPQLPLHDPTGHVSPKPGSSSGNT